MTTENTTYIGSEDSSYNCGKVDENFFPKFFQNIQYEQGCLVIDREDREFKKRSAIDWARVKLDWEGGQPNCSMVQDIKLLEQN